MLNASQVGEEVPPTVAAGLSRRAPSLSFPLNKTLIFLCKRSYPLNTKNTVKNIVLGGNDQEESSSVQWERQEHLR